MESLPFEILRLTPVGPGPSSYSSTGPPISPQGQWRWRESVKRNQRVRNPISPSVGKVPQRKSADGGKHLTEHHQCDCSIF